jgi:hypothetical protein
MGRPASGCPSSTCRIVDVGITPENGVTLEIERGLVPIVCGLPDELLDVFSNSHIVKFGQTFVDFDVRFLRNSERL